MTPAMLRAAGGTLANPSQVYCEQCDGRGALGTCPFCDGKGRRTVHPSPEDTTCARAALALAELMPHLEAFADEWAKPNAHAVTLHAPGFSVAVVDLLVALGKAKESLQ